MIETTAYRPGAMHEANYHKEQLRLDFPSIFDIDTFPGCIDKTWGLEMYSKTSTPGAEYYHQADRDLFILS